VPFLPGDHPEGGKVLPGFFVFNGRKLAGLRKDRGWSQYGLSFATKVPQPAIWQYESGQRNPSRATLLRLAAALGVSPADLCDTDPAFEAVAR
jgi:transcriptional regulator with XRE-family HTH domain